MAEWKWIWWNLGHGPTDKDDLIRELRRELEAVKERELELRRGEWVMKYFDAADEIERLRVKYDRLLNHIQLVAQSPDSRFARDILRYYYPLSQNGVGTSITLKWIDDEAVRGE